MFFYVIDVVTVVSKLSKACVLRITGDSLVFIVPDEHSIPRRTVLWAVLEQNGFFEHYDMVGVSALQAQNEIFLEFNISKFIERCTRSSLFSCQFF